MYARLASLQSGPKPQAAPHRKEARQRCCELVNACDVQARGRKSPVPFSGHAYEFQEENHESTIGPAVNRISARDREHRPDRKSTRLNSSHLVISYAVFCLKKKNIHKTTHCHL